jgi:flagellar M-ring protein FliF
MDWLSQGSQQFAQLVRSLSPAARFGLVLLLLVFVASLACLFRPSRGPGDIELFGSRVLSDREIARLEAAFAKAGLNDWEVVENRVRVPRQQRYSYLAAAHTENSLPPDFDSILEETLKGSTPFEPKELRDMKRNFAMQRELAGIIDALDGVERATVKVNEERAGPFSREIKRTALVAARATSGEFLTAVQVDAIRRTIASGTGTPPENIVVTDLRGVAHSGHAPPGSPSPYEHLFSAEKKKYEQYYQEKISQSLSMIPGVVVGVNIELTKPGSEASLIPGFDNSTPLAASRSPPRTERAGHVPLGIGENGLGHQAEEVAISVRNDDATTSKSPLSMDDAENRVPRGPHASLLKVGSSEVRTPRPGSPPAASRRGEYSQFGTVDDDGASPSVTATIQVPRSYFHRIWRQQGGPDSDADWVEDSPELTQLEREETERIQEAVRNLLPQWTEDGSLRSQVVVQSFADGNAADSEQKLFHQQALNWFVEHRAAWISLACGVFGLLIVPWVLLAIRSAVRPEETSMDFDDRSSSSEASERRTSSRQPEWESGGGSAGEDDSELQDRLLQLVRNQPDVAAAVLSKWIEDAA